MSTHPCSYILDFYKHGSKRALVRANGLLEGDAWQVGGQRWEKGAEGGGLLLRQLRVSAEWSPRSTAAWTSRVCADRQT